MRQLILHRQRALACFALRYHCILNEERASFLAKLTQRDNLELMGEVSDYVLRNGETIAIPIDEGENTFFAAIYLEKKQLATEPVVIAPGTEDVRYQIVTDFNGANQMTISIAPMA
jgi:hypothetical protein